MRILPTVLATVACASLSAQQTLTVDPNSYTTAAGLTYSQAGGANFFDLSVTAATGITLQALEIPTQEPVGTTGTIELWVQTLGTTHVGVETLTNAPVPSNDPSGWQLLTLGQYASGGFAVPSTTCQSAFTVNVPDTFLAAGDYGFAIVYNGVAHEFWGVTQYPAPQGTFFDGNIEVSNGTTAPAAWGGTLGAFVFNGVNYAGTMPGFGITYSVGPVAHACAETEVIGQGSDGNVASWFDLIEDANNVSAALQGRGLEFVNTTTGYIIGEATNPVFRPTSGNETVMPAVDNGEFQFNLPNLPVPYPTAGGLATTTDIWVHSNGYVSLTGPNSPLFFVPIDPQAAMDQDELTIFGMYHDFDPTEPGSGQILIEEDLTAQPNPTLYITWENVESFPTGVANPSTFQIQIDLAVGNIVVVYETIDAVGGSTFAGGDDTLIGWSPAGVSPVVTEGDFTTLGTIGGPNNFLGQLPEVRPLTLQIVGDPLLGQSFTLETTNVPSVPSIGTTIIDAAVTAPIPLDPLGAAPGTNVYVPVTTSLLFPIDNSNTTLVIPTITDPALVGFEIYGQSFWFDLPQLLGGNVFGGLIGSNAVRARIGTF